MIQSGDEKSSNPKHKKGKEWTKDGAHWKQKHDNGKDVKTYSVSFVGGGGSCAPVLTTEVRVTYQLTSGEKAGEKVVVLLGRADKPGPEKEKEPAITVAAELIVDNSKEQPTLTLPLEGKIVSIWAGGNVCSEPVSAKLQPVK